jgi:hypothetical protein
MAQSLCSKNRSKEAVVWRQLNGSSVGLDIGWHIEDKINVYVSGMRDDNVFQTTSTPAEFNVH